MSVADLLHSVAFDAFNQSPRSGYFDTGVVIDSGLRVARSVVRKNEPLLNFGFFVEDEHASLRVNSEAARLVELRFACPGFAELSQIFPFGVPLADAVGPDIGNPNVVRSIRGDARW